MKRHNILSYFMTLTLIFAMFISIFGQTSAIHAKSVDFIVLSSYDMTLNIGDEAFITAFSTGNVPKFKSSDRKIATVNSYGKVTAKSNGTCKITAYTTTSEASCNIRVNKTEISLNKKSVTLERNETFKLTAVTSNNSIPKFRSNKKSVAVVEDNGTITGKKPGEATISIKADKTTVYCNVKVKQPTIKLNRLYLALYRNQTAQLTAEVSSGISPTWKSNRTKVATVDNNGRVTARKNGTALITAKADGVTKVCEVVVEKPEITLGHRELTLRKGESETLEMSISSGNAPQWSSSKTSVATVDQLGTITAVKKGTSVITVSEDGTKEKCTVHVTD